VGLERLRRQIFAVERDDRAVAAQDRFFSALRAMTVSVRASRAGWETCDCNMMTLLGWV